MDTTTTATTAEQAAGREQQAEFERVDRQLLKLLSHWQDRRRIQYPRNASGKRSAAEQRAIIEFMVGAAMLADAMGDKPMYSILAKLAFFAGVGRYEMIDERHAALVARFEAKAEG